MKLIALKVAEGTIAAIAKALEKVGVESSLRTVAGRGCGWPTARPLCRPFN
jgi:hypothetical protein